MSVIVGIIFFGVILNFMYRRSSGWHFLFATAGYLLFVTFVSHASLFSNVLLWLIAAGLLTLFFYKPVRRLALTRFILHSFHQVMPKMSETEQQALEAGTVGWTGDLFSGAPNWEKLLALPGPQLSTEEQAFLDGPVETLCSMLNDWEISRSMTIPVSVWDFLKANGFFSMIIPKKYGGKEFSALAHSAVIAKVSGVSTAVATTIGVPNSLGPAELLMHYGTDAQRDYYLPRLASGEEIPCFALTSPRAGSDASAIEDHGIICEAEFEGKKQLCISLNWNKRYITLSPVATLLGLAFKLYDPNKLIGEQEELGITCALIPTKLPNVVTGRRHFPLNCAFLNGPTQGNNVIIPVDYIIGGVAMAGHGWRMLMECLAVGRSISLPSMVSGGSRRSTLCAGAYVRIRRQFNVYVGQFEGVQTVLARMVANVYALEAVRLFTVSSIDRGERPVVESAISKYHTTEFSRHIAMDAMDVHGGKGICMGPNNYLAQSYMELPIGITVEGANILTRSMIIFGQGAIRCHPYVLNELKAANNPDLAQGLIDFDKAVFGHAGFLISNQLRASWLSITGGRFTRAPNGPLKRYYQQFSRFSAALAKVADDSMLAIGGALKRLENLSARLGDLLSYLYIGSAVLKHYSLADEATQAEELPLVCWICDDLLYKLQNTMHDFLINFPNHWLGYGLRTHIFPFGRHFNPPSDKLSMQVAELISKPGKLREHLSRGLYHTEGANNFVINLGKILEQAMAVEPLLHKINIAKRHKAIKGVNFAALIADAVEAKVVTAEEGEQLLNADAAKMTVINVDDFSPDEPFFRGE